MWVRSFSKIYKNVSKEVIWKLWIDVNNWPSWQPDLESCKLEGEFKVGSYFMLKPKNATPVKITLIDVDWGKSFTDCTQFFGATMWDTHSLEETSEGIKLTNTLKVTGPLRWLWIHLVAKQVAQSIPSQMNQLISVAQKK